jgi:hypothetical protein
MSVTVTEVETIKKALNQADPNKVADAIRKIAMGDMLDVVEETIAVSPAAATLNLEALSSVERGALVVQSVEVLAGAAAAGVRIIGPSTATPSATVVRLSTDGKTLTFEANVTSVRVRFVPAPAESLDSAFASTT